MVDDLSIVEEELAKIRFILTSFLVLIYIGIVGGTLVLSLMYPPFGYFFVVIFIFEMLMGFLLLSSYGALIENLRKRRRNIENKSTQDTAKEQKTEA